MKIFMRMVMMMKVMIVMAMLLVFHISIFRTLYTKKAQKTFLILTKLDDKNPMWLKIAPTGIWNTSSQRINAHI